MQVDDGNALISSEDKKVIENICSVIDDKKKIPTAFWPSISDTAISEYDASINLFACAFPWLFPGGVGDFREEHKNKSITVGDWAEQLLYYRDGRFVEDKMWCFYALNYVT